MLRNKKRPNNTEGKVHTQPLRAGVDPASKFGGGDFSNVWQSSLIMRDHCKERWIILHNIAV